jgi:ubiquinone/menaquinone biosynthesis C-methylase UbiE
MKLLRGTKDRIKELYDKMTEVPEFKSTAEVGLNFVLEFLDALPSGTSLLDVGPGKGKEASLAHQRGIKVTGLDISPKMLEVFKAEVPEAQAMVGNATEIPAAAEAYDAVMASNIILHLDQANGVKAIREFFRVLKGDGRLFLVTTVGDGAEELNERPWLKAHGIECWYFYHWKKEALRDELIKAGFKIEKWTEQQLIDNRPAAAFITARK